MIELNEHLREHVPKENTFDWLLNSGGVARKEVKNRRTVEFETGGKRYFIKIHRGCGWGEILKNIFQGKVPITSARIEWEALERLPRIGVSTLKVAGKGLRGKNPARQESFVITEAMEGMVSLEDLTRDWGGLTGLRQKLLKRALLKEVAGIARKLHESGMNHRDFYLCHFLVKDRRWTDWKPGDPLELVLIDLHRVQTRGRIPSRWLVKDLGGLLFSALDCGLTDRDLLRFIRAYRRGSPRQAIRKEAAFWRRVWKNARRLYEGFHGRPARLPGVFMRA